MTTKELVNKHAKLLQGNSCGRQPYDMFGIESPSGWNSLLDNLLSNITQHCEKNSVPFISIAQIKEKFGGLRFYYDGGDDAIYNLVSQAEKDSYFTCQICGNQKAKTKSKQGWMQTLCPDCDRN